MLPLCVSWLAEGDVLAGRLPAETVLCYAANCRAGQQRGCEVISSLGGVCWGVALTAAGCALCQALLAPVAKEMEAAQAKTTGRRSAEDHHYKLVAEAMGALSWVCYQPGVGLSLPPKHVEENVQSADFYANKVLMEHRSSDPRHVEWVKAVKATFAALKALCQSHFATGVNWNASGCALADFSGDAAPAPAAPKKAAPKAPPPPPPGFLEERARQSGGPKPAAAKPADGMSAVFSELAKGDGVTSGLRKVPPCFPSVIPILTGMEGWDGRGGKGRQGCQPPYGTLAGSYQAW